mmetsp:Transcript_6406/g.13977  ORF Transcript_6406/g.13977 Transcript_6406/m.13977 type:complete len:170 (-) Transcript_6406:943-1452(-)
MTPTDAWIEMLGWHATYAAAHGTRTRASACVSARVQECASVFAKLRERLQRCLREYLLRTLRLQTVRERALKCPGGGRGSSASLDGLGMRSREMARDVWGSRGKPEAHAARKCRGMPGWAMATTAPACRHVAQYLWVQHQETLHAASWGCSAFTKKSQGRSCQPCWSRP